jgi:putative hemolysin
VIEKLERAGRVDRRVCLWRGVLPEFTLKRLGVFPWCAFVLKESIFRKAGASAFYLLAN